MKPTPERGFPDDEYAARCAALQAAMAREAVDAVLFASEAEIRYFTGFMTPFWQSPTRPWYVLLPLTGKPVAVIPSIGGPLMRSCHVDDVLTWSAPAESDDGVSLLASTIRQHAAPGQRLGLLMGRETALRMPAADMMALRTMLPDIALHDMTADVQRIRMVKSPREIAKIRHICGIVCNVFDDLPDWVEEGMPLAELFREFKRAALAAGADDVSYLVGTAGPEGYNDIIAPPDERPLATGDVLMLDTGCVWDGYFCDFDRNFAIVSASAAAQEAHRKLHDAIEAALTLARPGTSASELFTAMDRVLRDGSPGDDDVGRYGHGLGIQLTEPPSHTEWDHTQLRTDMVITLEPSISYISSDGEQQMMVAEENLIITKTGAELLTRRAPRELPVIGGRTT
ncbi:MAG: Xaa-Pro peptidase family protein [Pseudomonadota bacterium]|nr:Xaa-Pro peptidase family protein [Pseudomonadota bacterium]